MKKLFSTLIALVSVSAFAQNVVYLDSTDIDLGTNAATLVKTPMTPNMVTLNLVVPTQVKRCDPGDYMTVTSGAQCGYDSVARRCGGRYGGGYGGYGTPRRTGPNYRPPRTGGGNRPRRGTSIPAGRRYNPARGGMSGGSYGYPSSYNCGYDQVPRTCSVCRNPYYVTVDMRKTFDIQFERFNKDATIEFSLDQYSNLVLNITGISPRCIKKTIYTGTNNEKTGAKIKLKRSCR